MFSGVDFMNIPFNKIYINENDKKHIMNSLETGIIDGEGPYTSKVKDIRHPCP